MATRAHSTRTPLLRPSGSPQRLLATGLGPQPGPITIALAAMQAADPDRQRVRELRRRIAERIEADIALLDALDSDPDLEPSLGSPEPLGSNFRFVAPDGAVYYADDQARWAAGNTDDQEHDAGSDREEEDEHGTDLDAGEAGDDNGIADWQGKGEQAQRFLAKGGNLNAARGWL